MSGRRDIDEEAEANMFARCLLMPEDMVRRYVREHPGDLANDQWVKEFAKAFMVPIGVVGARLQELELI